MTFPDPSLISAIHSLLEVDNLSSSLADGRINFAENLYA